VKLEIESEIESVMKSPLEIALPIAQHRGHLHKHNTEGKTETRFIGSCTLQSDLHPSQYQSILNSNIAKGLEQL
jgi:hypothetical protein